jgi:hypothetical protein
MAQILLLQENRRLSPRVWLARLINDEANGWEVNS